MICRRCVGSREKWLSGICYQDDQKPREDDLRPCSMHLV